jgi:MerR family transcriptional regulator, thiopeptide resistance regulator
MLSVSQIARRCGLSRTTILYYESCGLLKPALRSGASYRLYGEKEVRILEQIRLYRSVGLSVRDIRRLLGGVESDAASLLQRRLRQLDEEVNQLRNHQRVILQLLRSKTVLRRDRNMTKDKWVAIMKAAGFKDDDMHRWHREFERSAPDDHEEFLKYLHLADKEVRTIREWSRNPKAD